MALPKEPRQKMINLMYLVLTALLALNVSNEIIEAFKTIDKSLINSNGLIEQKNQTLFKSFKDKMDKAETKEKATIWWNKAEKAKILSEEVYNYIETLKLDLKKEAKLKIVDGVEEFNEDNLEASTRMFVENKVGDVLKQKLSDFKSNLLNIDTAIGKEFANSLPLNLDNPPAKNSTAGKNDWAYGYFHMTPTVAALTILSKFQNDVKSSEAAIVEYCHKEIGEVEIVYDQFQAIASQSSEYIMPGQELRISAGVGAFSKSAQPSVTIDGSPVKLNSDGVAEYKTNVGGPGNYSKKVHIEFKKPDGTVGTKDTDIKYTVGSPTGASVSADAVKVLYIGLKNPLSVSGGNVGDERVSVNIDNGSLTKDAPGKYIAEPSKPGKATITLNIDNKPTPFEFRVKSVPDPAAMVGNSKGGPMKVNDFKAQAGVRAELENFVFEGVQFTVTGYTIVFQAAGFPELQYRQVKGNTFNDVRDLIERCKTGSAVTIDEIKVSGPGGTRQLPPIQFNLR